MKPKAGSSRRLMKRRIIKIDQGMAGGVREVKTQVVNIRNKGGISLQTTDIKIKYHKH